MLALCLKLMLIGFVTLAILFVLTIMLMTPLGQTILAVGMAIVYLAWEGRNG